MKSTAATSGPLGRRESCPESSFRARSVCIPRYEKRWPDSYGKIVRIRQSSPVAGGIDPGRASSTAGLTAAGYSLSVADVADPGKLSRNYPDVLRCPSQSQSRWTCAGSSDRGREDRLSSVPPPSEPCVRVSRTRLSG